MGGVNNRTDIPVDRSNQLPNVDLNNPEVAKKYLSRSVTAGLEGKEGLSRVGKVFSNIVKNIQVTINQIIGLFSGKGWVNDTHVKNNLNGKIALLERQTEQLIGENFGSDQGDSFQIDALADIVGSLKEMKEICSKLKKYQIDKGVKGITDRLDQLQTVAEQKIKVIEDRVNTKAVNAFKKEEGKVSRREEKVRKEEEKLSNETRERALRMLKSDSTEKSLLGKYMTSASQEQLEAARSKEKIARGRDFDSFMRNVKGPKGYNKAEARTAAAEKESKYDAKIGKLAEERKAELVGMSKVTLHQKMAELEARKKTLKEELSNKVPNNKRALLAENRKKLELELNEVNRSYDVLSEEWNNRISDKIDKETAISDLHKRERGAFTKGVEHYEAPNKADKDKLKAERREKLETARKLENEQKRLDQLKIVPYAGSKVVDHTKAQKPKSGLEGRGVRGETEQEILSLKRMQKLETSMKSLINQDASLKSFMNSPVARGVEGVREFVSGDLTVEDAGQEITESIIELIDFGLVNSGKATWEDQEMTSIIVKDKFPEVKKAYASVIKAYDKLIASAEGEGVGEKARVEERIARKTVPTDFKVTDREDETDESKALPQAGTPVATKNAKEMPKAYKKFMESSKAAKEAAAVQKQKEQDAINALRPGLEAKWKKEIEDKEDNRRIREEKIKLRTAEFNEDFPVKGKKISTVDDAVRPESKKRRVRSAESPAKISDEKVKRSEISEEGFKDMRVLNTLNKELRELVFKARQEGLEESLGKLRGAKSTENKTLKALEDEKPRTLKEGVARANKILRLVEKGLIDKGIAVVIEKYVDDDGKVTGDVPVNHNIAISKAHPHIQRSYREVVTILRNES